MKCTVKLVTEVVPGEPIEEEVATIEREDLVSPATVGLTIAEGKLILERMQPPTGVSFPRHYEIYPDA